MSTKTDRHENVLCYPRLTSPVTVASWGGTIPPRLCRRETIPAQRVKNYKETWYSASGSHRLGTFSCFVFEFTVVRSLREADLDLDCDRDLSPERKVLTIAATFENAAPNVCLV